MYFACKRGENMNTNELKKAVDEAAFYWKKC